MYFQQQGKFQPLDQVVLDSEYPSCPLLLKCADVKQYIQHVTEEKGEKKGWGEGRQKKKNTQFVSVTSLQDRFKYCFLFYQTTKVLDTAVLQKQKLRLRACNCRFINRNVWISDYLLQLWKTHAVLLLSVIQMVNQSELASWHYCIYCELSDLDQNFTSLFI